MEQEDSPRYLLVVEIERKGFLIEICRDIEKAKQRMEELVDLTVKYPFEDMPKVEQELTYFASYEIHGNEVYVRKASHSISNGSYTVSVVPVDLDTFCVKTFIRERENHSCAIDFSNYSDELTHRLLTMFPHFSSVAN